MEAKAIAKTVRMAPIKSRLTMDLIRGKSVRDAMGILKNTHNKASKLIEKVLVSAVANAENNLSLDREKLYVKEAYINEGPVMKRVVADSRGRSGRSDRRTSHITIVVSERN